MECKLVPDEYYRSPSLTYLKAGTDTYHECGILPDVKNSPTPVWYAPGRCPKCEKNGTKYAGTHRPFECWNFCGKGGAMGQGQYFSACDSMDGKVRGACCRLNDNNKEPECCHIKQDTPSMNQWRPTRLFYPTADYHQCVLVGVPKCTGCGARWLTLAKQVVCKGPAV